VRRYGSTKRFASWPAALPGNPAGLDSESRDARVMHAIDGLNHPVSRRSAIPRKAAKRRARDAPVMHGLCCRCQERQRQPPTPTSQLTAPVGSRKWLARKFEHVSGGRASERAGASSTPAPDDRVSSFAQLSTTAAVATASAWLSGRVARGGPMNRSGHAQSGPDRELASQPAD
jgi:hypothetical protein